MRALPVATALFASLALCLPAFALSGEEIADTISGRTVHLATPYGLEMPLAYAADGSVSGDVSGFSMASMFAPRETGRWWIDGNRMCQQWPTWYDGETHCFTLSSQGDNSLSWERDDGLAGTARIAE